MNRRTARGNRIGLAIVGAVLLLAGIAALLRALDLVPDLLGAADEPVIDQSTSDFVADQDWFWPVLAAALILVALLSLRWLLVQTRTGAVGTLRLDADAGHGATRMPARTLTGAIEDDLDRSPLLDRPRATLTGGRTSPHLRLSASVAPAADPGEVRARVQDAIDRCRQALESPTLRSTVLLRR